MKHSTLQLFNPSTLASTAVAALCAATAGAADISDVIVRQQWPWSTDIKVEYKLTNMTGPVTVNVEAFDGDTPLDSSNLKAAITGDLWGITESGAHSFIIDPAAAFGAARNSIGDFKVRLSLTDAPANAADILYKIVDLDPPYTVTDVRRRDFYNGKYGSFVTNFSDIATGWTTSLDDVLIWTGVTEDDTYKTNKMVFRRIPAAGKSYMMQTNNASVNGGAGVEVSFTKDFYIGVFEVTQTQMNKFYRYYGAKYDYPAYPPGTGYFDSWETNNLYRATRAASQMCLDHDSKGTPIRPYNQSLTDHTKVAARTGTANGTLCYNMQNKTGLLIDLPTEAMWEFACRAGTTTALYSGKAWSYNEADKLGTLGRSSNDRNIDLSRCSNAVGLKKPNAFGLYDMLGNVLEWCLDKAVSAGTLPGGTNPVSTSGNWGSYPSETHILRGGGWNHGNESASSNYRTGIPKQDLGRDYGCRLCIYLDNHDDGTK